MKIAAIIPARGGSKRLPEKNIYPLFGKPLIAYAIEACRRSSLVTDIFVSSDDAKILKIAAEYKAVPLLRDPQFADDQTPKITSIREAVRHSDFVKAGPFDVLVIAQANSPEIRSADIDRGIQFLLDNNLWEVMSADKNGIQNAAFRIIRSEHLNNEFLSAHCGFIIAECRDIHTIEDIQELEKHRELFFPEEKKEGGK